MKWLIGVIQKKKKKNLEWKKYDICKIYLSMKQ